MGADYSFHVKSIATFALTFFGYIISVLASVFRDKFWDNFNVNSEENSEKNFVVNFVANFRKMLERILRTISGTILGTILSLKCYTCVLFFFPGTILPGFIPDSWTRQTLTKDLLKRSISLNMLLPTWTSQTSQAS